MKLGVKVEGLFRKPVKEPQPALFEIPPSWQEHWWGMPEFSMVDARPAYRITVNLYTLDDLREFGDRLGLPVTTSTDSITFPPRPIERPSDWVYCDEEQA
jgi:hypothetical protein